MYFTRRKLPEKSTLWKYEKRIPTYAQPFTKFETNIVLNLSSCVFIFYFLISDCYIQLYWFPRLHVLLCTSPLVICQIVAFITKLSSSRYVIFIDFLVILRKNNWIFDILSDDPGVRGRLNECLETILNKAQEPPKSKKVQHSNAKNSVLFEAISLIIHNDR